jgi:hypothetical protein
MRLRVSFYIQRSGTGKKDDILSIYEDDSYLEMYRFVYQAADLHRKHTFYLPRSKVIPYVSDLLKSLTHDIEPFEAVQVSSSIFPSVVYHVSDLDDPDVRHLIEDMVSTSLRRVSAA